MAGHSKWANIKRQKAVNDKARGKVFTRHARLIEVAATGGADPSQNAALAQAVAAAKADNVPNENIDRAIKKASERGRGRKHACAAV